MFPFQSFDRQVVNRGDDVFLANPFVQRGQMVWGLTRITTDNVNAIARHPFTRIFTNRQRAEAWANSAHTGNHTLTTSMPLIRTDYMYYEFENNETGERFLYHQPSQLYRSRLTGTDHSYEELRANEDVSCSSVYRMWDHRIFRIGSHLTVVNRDEGVITARNSYAGSIVSFDMAERLNQRPVSFIRTSGVGISLEIDHLDLSTQDEVENGRSRRPSTPSTRSKEPATTINTWGSYTTNSVKKPPKYKLSDYFDGESGVEIKDISEESVRLTYECGEVILNSDGTYQIKNNVK